MVTRFPQVSMGASSSSPCSYQMLIGNCVPIAVHGVKVLRDPIGKPEYCASKSVRPLSASRKTLISSPACNTVGNLLGLLLQHEDYLPPPQARRSTESSRQNEARCSTVRSFSTNSH